MAELYHINSQGQVSACKASVRSCPFSADEHSSNPSELQHIADLKHQFELDPYNTVNNQPVEQIKTIKELELYRRYFLENAQLEVSQPENPINEQEEKEKIRQSLQPELQSKLSEIRKAKQSFNFKVGFFETDGVPKGLLKGLNNNLIPAIKKYVYLNENGEIDLDVSSFTISERIRKLYDAPESANFPSTITKSTDIIKQNIEEYNLAIQTEERARELIENKVNSLFEMKKPSLIRKQTKVITDTKKRKNILGKINKEIYLRKEMDKFDNTYSDKIIERIDSSNFNSGDEILIKDSKITVNSNKEINNLFLIKKNKVYKVKDFTFNGIVIEDSKGLQEVFPTDSIKQPKLKTEFSFIITKQNGKQYDSGYKNVHAFKLKKN